MSIQKNVFLAISKLLAGRNVFVTKSLNYAGGNVNPSLKFDFVRHNTLLLCAGEINNKNVKGAVAELGVYKGDFAEALNRQFPGRRLYLFDTFSGFSEEDITLEQSHNLSKGNQDFSDTDERKVLARMPFPEQCIVRKGVFPETTTGIDHDESFCFVSLDADLYAPIRSGLDYFYERLSEGGYIFVHDYHNENYPGVRKAVEEFCWERKISFVPIPDGGGSVVIAK